MNPNAFNGDTLLAERIAKLIRDKHITLVVETGTYHGVTTEMLASVAPWVVSAESNPLYQKEALVRLKDCKNVDCQLGPSPDIIQMLQLPRDGQVLFFLDAHWGYDWPLLDELRQIKLRNLKPLILIHDFKVPDHPEFGYDVYGANSCEWDYVRDLVVDIYGVDRFVLTYPTEAAGSRRGWILIEPL